MPLISVPFQELDLIPEQDGFSANCWIAGNAIVHYDPDKRWTVEAIEVEYTKFDAHNKTVRTQLLAAQEPILTLAKCALLNDPNMREHIENRIREDLLAEPFNERQCEQGLEGVGR